MVTEKDAFFEVDSRLLFEIGEKLVTNRAIALAELVKNSYDADATKAIITLHKVRNPGGTITIQDDGVGLNEDAFQKGWMRIATIYSEENPVSKKFKRKKSGRKGIGRFACRKLAKKLSLTSVSEEDDGSKIELIAKFDWPTFIPGSDVDKIPSKYSIKKVDPLTPTGTVLKLEHTTEPWTERNITRLKNEISELFTPLIFLEEEINIKKIEQNKKSNEFDPGFNYEIISNDFFIGIDSLNKTFFQNAWAILTGSVDRKGMAVYECAVQNKIVNKFIRELQRENPFTQLKCAKFKIFIFSYRTDLFKYDEWTSAKSYEIGRKRGGVKVYADNFKIFGYGEEGNDWLCVDHDRARSRAAVDEELANFYNPELRPGLALFRNASLFGYVSFEQDKNSNLEILINRDRLDSESQAFKELRKFVRLGIDFATVLYKYEIDTERENKDKLLKTKFEAVRKEEEEKRRFAEEEKKRADESANVAEIETLKAEEEEKKARFERQLAEEKRRKAEEERRKAESIRREAEDEARERKLKEAWLKAENAYRIELEKIKIENELRKIEEEKRLQEEQAIKNAEEKRKNAISTAFSSIQEIKKADEEIINLQRTELSRESEKYRQEFSRLRVLASTGTLIFIFTHEIHGLIEDMKALNHRLSKIIQKTSQNERQKYLNDLKIFNDRIQMIKDFRHFLGLSLGQESQSEMKQWIIKPIMDEIQAPFKLQLQKRGIQFNNAIPDTLRSPLMFRSELIAIIHNLMSNSIKMVTGKPERRIEINGLEENDIVIIRFLDSGPGLDKTLWEKVFEPFISYSEPDLVYGAGTGLGLKIVRDIVKAYDGEVHFIDPPEGWNTCVEIKFPLV